MPGNLPYIYISICTVAFLEAIYILIHRPSSASNQAFFVFASGTGIWIGGMGALLLTHSFVFVDILNTGGLLAVIGITWFSYSFPEQKPYPASPLLFWAPLFLGGAYLICSRQIIARVFFLPEGTMAVTQGIGMPAWAFLLSAYVLIAMARFYRSFRMSTKDDAARIFLIYIGICVFLSCSIMFDVLLPGFFSFTSLNSVGPISAIVFLCAIAYSLIAKTFLDIQLAIQRGLIFTFCFAFIACVYALFLVLIDSLFVQEAHFAYFIVASLTILVGIYTFPRIETYFRNVSDPLFFKKDYSYFSTLDELTRILNENLDLRSLVVQSLQVLEKTFRPTYAFFIQINTIQCYSHEACTCKRPLDSQSDVQVPIRSGQELVGTFLIGARKSGDRYTREDEALLRTFERAASIAFEKAQLYEQLQNYTEGLETEIENKSAHLERLHHQQEFFNDISHALQTPLTVLSGNLEQLSGKSGIEELYENLYKAYSDISRLVQSILRIAGIENQQLNDTIRFDLSELLGQIVQYVRIIADMEEVELSLHSNSNCFVTGSRTQLEEAIANILSNAIKYTSGCVRRKVEVRLSRGDVLHKLQVTDTGVGMTMEQSQHIFDRYYRARTSKQRGHGLGMAITKRIIDQHRGTIAIESQPGVGTRVLMFIPAVTQEGGRN